MSRRNSGFLVVLWALLLLAMTTAAAQALTYTWNGGNGNWKAAGNWSPNTGPPNNYDTAIIPSGTVTLDTLYSVKNLTLGAAATLNITQWGLNLLSDNPENTCLVTNNGSIQVINPGPDTSGLGSALGSIVTFTGGGEVVLGGPYNNMGNGGHGGSFINDVNHTIRGGGYIQAGVTNKGQIIADNGILYLQAPFINESNIRVEGAANTIDLSSATITGGWLYPENGKVTMGSCELINMNLGSGVFEVQDVGTKLFRGNVATDPGTQLTISPGAGFSLTAAPDGTPATFTNQAVIQMQGQGSAIHVGIGTTLTGTGRIVMGAEADNYIGTDYYDGPAWTQGPNHTIEGGGTLDGYLTNNGKIKANNGILTVKVWAVITGSGDFEVADNATLNVEGSLTRGDFFLPALSSFLCGNDYSVYPNGSINLLGNFSFAQRDVTKLIWGKGSTLQMSGGGTWQSLEAGGKDLGADPAGLNNNFALRELKVEGTGTQVYLVDAIDNGHRSPGVREALYTAGRPGFSLGLTVSPGATLNLNGIHFYAYWGSDLRRVQAGDGDKYGGGQIIDVPVEGYKIVPVLPLLLLD